MSNATTTPKSTATLRTYEQAGQLDLMRDKSYNISDILDELQGGTGGSYEIDDTNGAIGITAGTVFLTKAGVAAMTLAAPVTADNGKILRVLATTAQANTVTCPSNKINGNAAIATFGGAIGDCVIFIALATKWFVLQKTNVTLS